MSNKLFIGIDTSNYTTSVAICDESGNILTNLKRLLPVKEGERGLRQSEAVFAHVKNFPIIADKLNEFLALLDGDYVYSAIAVSATPRDAEGSYMPCFLVGVALAEMLSAVLQIPLYKTSHQVGHILAAASSAVSGDLNKLGEILAEEHFALHVSGGTTDLLLVSPDDEKIVSIERIGGSSDANAGQIVDRTGVRLGFPFPCGPYIDEAAVRYGSVAKGVAVSVKGTDCNMSGLENKAIKLIEEGKSIEEVSVYVLEYVAKSIERVVSNAFDMFGKKKVVFAGGVMSSRYIKKRLSHLGMFSEPQYSSDNASGVAIAASILFGRNGGKN